MKRDTSRLVLRGPGGTANLTPRQVQVLQLAARGLGDKEIATHLGISPRTVADRFRELRERTGARTRTELIARAAEAGLVQLEHSQRFIDNKPLSIVSTNNVRKQAHGLTCSCPGAATSDEPLASAQKVLNDLHKVQSERDRLNDTERTLIDLARRRGASWSTIGRALGLNTAQAAQQRRKRLGSRGTNLPSVFRNPEAKRIRSFPAS